MANSDIYNATLIIIIFTILMGSLSLTISLAEIRKQWNEHRCNPLIMPIAGILNPEISTPENFKYCVQDLQIRFMASFLTPFRLIVDYLQQLGFTFINIFSYLKQILNVFGIDINSLFNYFNTIVTDIVGQFETAITQLTDTVSTISDSLENIDNVYKNTLDKIEKAYDANDGPGALIKVLEDDLV